MFQVSKKVPNLKIEYEVDSRQQIADSWPMVGSYLALFHLNQQNCGFLWFHASECSNSLSNALARCSTTPWQERTGAGNIISDLNNLSTSWSLISGGLDRDNDLSWFWQLHFRRIYKKWGNGQYWYALVIIKCHCWIRYYWCTFISFLVTPY